MENKTIDDVVKEFKREIKLAGKDMAIVKSTLSLFFNYAKERGVDVLRLKLFQAQDFQSYLVTLSDDKGNLRFCKKSVFNIISCIKVFYAYLKRKGMVASNPFVSLKRNKFNKGLPKNILNEEKMNTLLSYLRDFHNGKGIKEKKDLYKAHVISELMYSTGARINEIMKLKPCDIDFENGLIRIEDTKSNQIRNGILNEYTVNVLKRFMLMRRYVVFGKNGGNWDLLFGSAAHLCTWINVFLNKTAFSLGLGKFTSHHFRHALGYHLLRNGCDIRFIQSILGHKKLNTTQIYTKVDKDDLRNVIDKYHPRVFGGKNEG